MAKTSTVVEVGQEGSLREGLTAAIRERAREIMEMALQEEVAAALGAPRGQRVAERAGFRRRSKQRKLAPRTGTIQLDMPRHRRQRKSCSTKKEFHDFTPKMRYSLFYRFPDTTLAEQAHINRYAH